MSDRRIPRVPRRTVLAAVTAVTAAAVLATFARLPHGRGLSALGLLAGAAAVAAACAAPWRGRLAGRRIARAAQARRRAAAAPAAPATDSGHGPVPRTAAGDGILRVPRRAALAAITVLVVAASLVSFAESYRGLYVWAHRHGLTGAWALIWPLQVDVFIAVGELALFVALADRWPSRSRGAAWTITLTGLAVSVAGNVGHVTGHAPTNRVTAAVPPLAAAAALAVGLGALKRIVAAHHAAVGSAETCPWPRPAPVLHAAPATAPDRTRTQDRTPRTRIRDRGAPRTRIRGQPVTDEAAEVHFAADLAEGRVPSVRRIKAELHVGQDRAARIHDHLAAVAASTDHRPDRDLSGRTR